MTKAGYTFLISKWRTEQAEITRIRNAVFFEELGLDKSIFGEEDDELAYHILVFDAGGRAVATTRMQKNGRVDYVAVLKPWRGNTVGGALLTYLHHIAHVTKLEILWSDTLPSARNFFTRNGFEVVEDIKQDPSCSLHVVRKVEPPRTPGSLFQ